MKPALILLLALCFAAPAGPVEKLRDFDLSDQHEKTRAYRFPKSKVTVMTVADHKGSEQLAPWIQNLRDRYGERVDIDGVADMSSVPGVLQGVVRRSFRKQLAYSVMLDWEGDVVKQLAPQKGVANIYVVDRAGRIVTHVSGPISDKAVQSVTREVERALADETENRSQPKP